MARQSITSMSSSTASIELGSPPSHVDEDELTPLQESFSNISNHASKFELLVLSKSVEAYMSPRVSAHDTDDDDDKDDEEIMSSLQRNDHHLEISSQINLNKSPNSTLRRTPGANAMHRSLYNKLSNIKSDSIIYGLNHHTNKRHDEYNGLRRTPGASVMHRSVRDTVDIALDTTALAMEKSVELKNHVSLASVTSNRPHKNHSIDRKSSGALEFGLTSSYPIVMTHSAEKNYFLEDKNDDRDQHSNCHESKFEKSRVNEEKCESIAPTKIVKERSKTRQKNHVVTLNSPMMSNYHSYKGKSTIDINVTGKAMVFPIPHKKIPLNSNVIRKENFIYTPAAMTLAKNEELNFHLTTGVISPHTFRLTDSLDKLFFEAEDDEKDRKNENSDHTREINDIKEEFDQEDSIASKCSVTDESFVSKEMNKLIHQSSSSTFSSPMRKQSQDSTNYRVKLKVLSPLNIQNSSFCADSFNSQKIKVSSHEDWCDVYTFECNRGNNDRRDSEKFSKSNSIKQHTSKLKCGRVIKESKLSYLTDSGGKNSQNFGKLFQPKPVQSSFHRYTRCTSSSVSNNSRTENGIINQGDGIKISEEKRDLSSSPRPVNFNPYPSGSGAFASLIKNTSGKTKHQHTLQPKSTHSAKFHISTPKNSTSDAHVASTNSRNYNFHQFGNSSGLDMYNKVGAYYAKTKNEPVIIHNHHYYGGMPPTLYQGNNPSVYDGAMDRKGFTFDNNSYQAHSDQYSGDSSAHVTNKMSEYQHQHLSGPIGNIHMEFSHPHHLRASTVHQPVSPATMPSVLSPLNVPSFAVQSTNGMKYASSISPVAFTPHSQVPENGPWNGQHAHPTTGYYSISGFDEMKNQDKSWNAITDTTCWDHSHSHLLSDYRFLGRGEMIHTMSTSTPPFSPIPSSWLSSEFGDFNNVSIKAEPTCMNSMVYHVTSNHHAQEHAMSVDFQNFQNNDYRHLCAHVTQPVSTSYISNNDIRLNNDDHKYSARENIMIRKNVVDSLYHNGYPKPNKQEAKRNNNQRSNNYQNRRKSEMKVTKKEVRKQQMFRRSNSRIEMNSIDFPKNKKDELTYQKTYKVLQPKKIQLGNNFPKNNNRESFQNSFKNEMNMNVLPQYSSGIKLDTANYHTNVLCTILESTDHKNTALVESSTTRFILKEFYRKIRLKEKVSLQLAADYSIECLTDKAFPLNINWRIYLELADLSKRANNFDEARRLYHKVCHLQPYASQGWLEYSKLEEECGYLKRCSEILHEGLSHCGYNENLLTRAIKHEERLANEHRHGDLSKARQILARLKHIGIEKVWRAVLEGALLEARAGKEDVSRRVLKYLMHWVPWYGPLYLEAYRLERDSGRSLEALTIVERGLKVNPRYGPLWFGAFRLCEGLDLSKNDFHLPRMMEMINRATMKISRELLWKVFLEAAQAQERSSHLSFKEDKIDSLNKGLDLSRKHFAKTILACSENLCWKVWLAAGRMELSSGNPDIARTLFLKAFTVVPSKGRPSVLLECARLEEFVGNVKLARAILCKARAEAGSDWKVWLESVSMEMRNDFRNRAINLAQKALSTHTGTGRLWAALVQLRQPDGEDIQMIALRCSLEAVPKSGEVWCEAARIFLNPFSPLFDLKAATMNLDFATKFTPQYGDSFLETLRLQLLKKWIIPIAEHCIDTLENQIEDANWQAGSDHWKELYRILGICVRQAVRKIRKKERSFERDVLVGNTIDNLNLAFLQSIDTSDLELHCCNADPNYGKLWFHCRMKPTDTARTVLKSAKNLIGFDLMSHAHVYIAAMMRRAGIEFGFNKKICTESNVDRSILINTHIRSAPSISMLLNVCEDDSNCKEVLLLESSADFVTGLVQINGLEALESLSLLERRKVLFGSDLLFSWKQS